MENDFHPQASSKLEMLKKESSAVPHEPDNGVPRWFVLTQIPILVLWWGWLHWKARNDDLLERSWRMEAWVRRIDDAMSALLEEDEIRFIAVMAAVELVNIGCWYALFAWYFWYIETMRGLL